MRAERRGERGEGRGKNGPKTAERSPLLDAQERGRTASMCMLRHTDSMLIYLGMAVDLTDLAQLSINQTNRAEDSAGKK